MQLHFLGTTGYHPNNRRHTACLMLPELGVVFDAGSGLFRARDLLRTPTLDIFLSHAHLDHVLGLTFLFDVLFQKTMDRVEVYAEPDKIAALDEHLFSPLIFPVLPPFAWRPLERPIVLADGGVVRHFPLAHPGGAVGFRLDWPSGRSLAYVTDTTAHPAAPYLEHIRGVDLLVHECYFPDGWEEWAEKTGHSCTTGVAQVARAAGVGRMLLMHVTPLDEGDDPIGIDVARRIFPATEVAEDGLVVEV